MNSDDYKERFKSEYYQTKIRYDKLHKMLVKYEAKTLDFEPTCSMELLKEQVNYMGNYLRILEVRAEIENVELQVLIMENDKTYLRDINGCSIEQPVIYSGTEDPNTLLETTLKKSKDGDIYIKYTPVIILSEEEESV